MKNRNILFGGILGILAGLFAVFIVNALASNPTGQMREFVTRTPTLISSATQQSVAVIATSDGQPLESGGLIATPRFFHPTNTPGGSLFNPTPTRFKTFTPTWRPGSTLVVDNLTATAPIPVSGSSSTPVKPATSAPTSRPTQPPAPTNPPPTQAPPPKPTPVPTKPPVMPTAVPTAPPPPPPPPEPTSEPEGPPPPQPTPEG